MQYVYILKSNKNNNWIYVGSTNNLVRRMAEHKLGKSRSTRNFLPIYLVVYIAVLSEKKARELEKYLKIGSGKAFLKKRFLTNEAR